MQKKLLWISALVVVFAVGAYLYFGSARGRKEVPSGGEVKIEKGKIAEGIQRRGGLLFQKRRYQSIIAILEKVMETAPDNKETKQKLAEAYRGLADTEQELGDEAAAEGYMKRATGLDPRLRGDDR